MSASVLQRNQGGTAEISVLEGKSLSGRFSVFWAIREAVAAVGADPPLSNQKGTRINGKEFSEDI